MGGLVGAVAVVAGLVGAALHAANAAAGRSPTPSFWLMGVAAAVGYGSMAVLLRRSEAVWVRRVMGGIGLAQGVALVAQEWAWRGGTDALSSWALWLGSWLWAPAYVAVVALLPQLLPTGHPVSRSWRPALVLGTAAVAVVALGWALTPYDLQDFPGSLPPGLDNPVGIDAAASPAVGATTIVLVVAAALCSSASLVARWRHAAGLERQQLKWVVLGFAATVVLVVVGQLLPVGLTEGVAAAAMLPVPIASGVAALRHGLWGVDTVISRSLVYAGLSALVVVVYAVSVWALGAVLGATTGVPVVATVLAALAVLPVHTWLQRRVNRLVHGAVEEPYAAMARLGRRLEAASTPSDLAGRVLPEVVEELARMLRADRASLTLTDGTASHYPAGEPSNADGGVAVSVELDYAGLPVGWIELGRPGGFGPRDRELLDRLADQAAVAAHTVLLANEAKAAREAGALAREEERRRLRRDLHDDLGPSLAALALQADTARDLAGRDPAASLAVLERLVPRLNGTVDSVRALVHELRPPMLDELGLGAAVRELAARMSTPTTPVRAHVGDLPPVPAAVEVAVYRIAGEALANALRHARASEVRLTLTASDGVLALTVADDGAAGTAHRPGGGPGLGLSSMRERAEEIGGTLNVVWAAQGTTVAATLPVRPADGLAQEPADGVVA